MGHPNDCVWDFSAQFYKRSNISGNTGSKTFNELVEMMANHYDPKPSVILQWYRFNTTTRFAEELVTE